MKKKGITRKSENKTPVFSEEDIRKLAQQIYDERVIMSIEGNAESDWEQAKKKLGIG